MADVQIEDLQALIKDALRRRGMTYRELAEVLGMSESGIKKLLTAEDLSLARLAAICDALDVSVADLVAEAARPRREIYRPTSDQTAAYVHEPQLLVALWALIEATGRVESARARLGIANREMRRWIRRLSALEMIEVVDADRVRVCHPRITDWRLPPDVGRAVMAPIQDALIKSARARVEAGEGEPVELGLGRFRLHPNSIAELKRAMRALLAEFDARARRERVVHPSEALVDIGAMCVSSPFALRDAFESLA